MCLVVVAGGPAVARAQGVSVESTPQACSDRIDNDGDGYVDCYDPDCAAVCQRPAPAPAPTYAPPPAQPAPPPTYYAPPPAQPPPVYYQPAPVYRPVYVAPVYQPYIPRRGIADVIVGFVFLGIGAGLIGGSIPLWQACGGRCFDAASSYYGYGWGAVFMDIFGSAFLVTSLILIPSGFVKEAKYNKWQRERANRPVSLLDRLTPTLSAGPSGANAGLTLTF
jgi:hypothetical protein